jgi:spectinomycin phosphotransferase/16S rRNA (guanine(1405)-N(7))-methyltransferase
VVRTQPRDLTADELAQAMFEHWALEAVTLEYVPVGFGSHHWHVVADGERWFLTVDDLDAKQRARTDTRGDARRRLHAALATARELADGGLRFVVAPVLTRSGDVLVDVGDRFVAALYPHVVGQPRSGDGDATRAQQLDVLDLIVELHTSRPRHADVDDLAIAMLDELELAIDELARPWTAGPYSERGRRLLDEHAEPLLRLVAAYQRVAGEVLAGRDRFVLTHGEPHPGNTLVTERGVVLVDWDTALIAPPERDLWTLAGADHRVADAYTAATGVLVDDTAVVCYGVLWDLDEIAGYITLLRRPHIDDADVAESWRNLRHFLQPEVRWPRWC